MAITLKAEETSFIATMCLAGIPLTSYINKCYIFFMIYWHTSFHVFIGSDTTWR